VSASLEQAFMELTASSVEFHAGLPDGPAGQPPVHAGEVACRQWIPFNAGSGIWEQQANGVNPFSPWIGFAVFCGYAAVAIIAGLILFESATPERFSRPA
jgi:hypothetical protein